MKLAFHRQRARRLSSAHGQIIDSSGRIADGATCTIQHSPVHD